MKKYLFHAILLSCFVSSIYAQTNDSMLDNNDMLSMSFGFGLIIVIFIAISIYGIKQLFMDNKSYRTEAQEKYNTIKHCQEMKQLCLETIKEIEKKSILLDTYPKLTEVVCGIAEKYIDKKLKLKDFELLNKNSVKGYIYDTVYEIPIQIIPKVSGIEGMLANSELAGFCIDCIKLWHKEFPFVPDKTIKERKQKAKEKYGAEKNSFFNSIFDNKS